MIAVVLVIEPGPIGQGGPGTAYIGRNQRRPLAGGEDDGVILRRRVLVGRRPVGERDDERGDERDGEMDGEMDGETDDILAKDELNYRLRTSMQRRWPTGNC